MLQLMSNLTQFYHNFDYNNVKDCHRLFFYLNEILQQDNQDSDIAISLKQFLQMQCEQISYNDSCCNSHKLQTVYIPIQLSNALHEG